jgi:hypothetical protein
MFYILDDLGFYNGIIVEQITIEQHYTNIVPDKAYLRPKFDFSHQVWEEGENSEIVDSYKLELAKELDKKYTQLISNLLEKPVQKLLIEQVPIPQSVLDERDNLIAEFNQQITDLGIDKSQLKKP